MVDKDSSVFENRKVNDKALDYFMFCTIAWLLMIFLLWNSVSWICLTLTFEQIDCFLNFLRILPWNVLFIIWLIDFNDCVVIFFGKILCIQNIDFVEMLFLLLSKFFIILLYFLFLIIFWGFLSLLMRLLSGKIQWQCIKP